MENIKIWKCGECPKGICIQCSENDQSGPEWCCFGSETFEWLQTDEYEIAKITYNKAMIRDLKKGDRFRFNDKIYTVIKKYRNEESPLKATCNKPHSHPTLILPWQGGPDEFSYDELEIEKLKIKN